MFLNTIKNFLLKSKVSKLLSNLHGNKADAVIKSIGVLFDGNSTLKIEELLLELSHQGIDKNQLNVLLFKDKINKNEIFKFNVFTYKEISWSAEIENSKANLFLNTPFDLLINYHDFEKMPLVYASYLSKAKFKVGFTSKDKIVNQLMINTSPFNYQLFVTELFKYLKILKKI